MLKDLHKADWLGILGLAEADIPRVLILRGTRNFRRQYRAMLPFFSEVREVGSPNGIIEDVLIGAIAGQPVGFACVYGAAMASEIVHIFGVLGTRAVIQIGNCGALADGLEAGDLFIADRAYCGEGSAQYYLPEQKWIAASSELLQAKALLGTEYRAGPIYTTGALFAESEQDIERWHQDGFMAVDMETAATYAVAEHFGMHRLSILYAFDNPRQKEHLLLSDVDKDLRRLAADSRLKQLALEMAVQISGDAATPSRTALLSRPNGAENQPKDGALIRPCRLEEAEAVLHLWRQAGAAPSVTDNLESLTRAITTDPAIVLVAEQGGQIIGSIIGGLDGWRGNIYRLAVLPEYRRKGIARALVAEVERQLAKQGARRITALVLKEHSWATGFWRAVGYELDERMVRFAKNVDER